MSDQVTNATTAGEYEPAGEDQGRSRTFTAREIADAFDIDIDRVRNAMAGEFDLAADAEVSSKQAQEIAEVTISDQPLDKRTAALMKLGAFVPRADEIEGSLDETSPADQSDRLRTSEDVPDLGVPKERDA